MISIDTKAIRARAEAATKGPWRRHPNPRFYVQFDDGHFGGTDEEHEANARFCAAARTDVPALLDRIDELEDAAYKAFCLLRKATSGFASPEVRSAQEREAKDELQAVIGEVKT